MNNNKFITLITLVTFTFVTLFSPFPVSVRPVSAQSTVNTGSLRLVTSTSGFSFRKDLQLGDTDPDIRQLQRVLNSSADTMVASSGVGSPGQESTYFGPATKAAVIKFQQKYSSEILTPNGLTVGNGLVNQATRTQLNLLLGVTQTSASVGLPQSRAGSGNTSPSSRSGMSVCSFVNLLISIGVVDASRASQARSALGCTTVAPAVITSNPQASLSVCSFVNLLITIGVVDASRASQALSMMNCPANVPVVSSGPSVNVMANGSTGPIFVLSGATFTLSWNSVNTISCNDGLYTLPTSGSTNIVANTSLYYPIHCVGNNGNTVTGTVTVMVSNGNQATSTIQILGSSIIPSDTAAIFNVTTNEPTKMVIAYTNQPTATSSIRVYESATTTAVHSDTITGLIPNTLYYAQLGFVASPTDAVVSQQLTFTTTNSGLNNVQTNGQSTQRVLSSNGNGVVSVPGSTSLKTDSTVTLEAWVKPTSWNTTTGMSNTRDSVIISKGHIGSNIDYALTLDHGKLVYSNNDASLWTCSAVVPLNQWTQVSASISEYTSTINLYVNGIRQYSICQGPRGVFSAASQINRSNAITQQVANTTGSYSSGWGSSSGTGNSSSGWDSSGLTGNSSSLTSPQVTSNVYLGNFYPEACNATSTRGNGFVGFIDDVKIWNIARTDIQVLADAASSTASSTSFVATTTTGLPDQNLVAHWSFDNGQPTDLTNNLNNGALKGDMTIVDDATALSPLADSQFGLGGLSFNFPEACDSSLASSTADTVLSGYRITFKGGVKSVTNSGQDTNVELETCDNPTEDLVKSVTVIGNAPPKTAASYNGAGTVSVTIPANGGLGVSVPAVRDTIAGTATDYISGPGITSASANPNANWIGYASQWQPQSSSCLKPQGGLLGGGNFAIIGAVVLVVAAVASCAFAGCAFVPFLSTYSFAGGLTVIGATGATSLTATGFVGGYAIAAGAGTAVAGAAAVSAGAGYVGGSMIQQ